MVRGRLLGQARLLSDLRAEPSGRWRWSWVGSWGLRWLTVRPIRLAAGLADGGHGHDEGRQVANRGQQHRQHQVRAGSPARPEPAADSATPIDARHRRTHPSQRRRHRRTPHRHPIPPDHHHHFEGHGIGKLLVPLVVEREARKEMPVNLSALKERLERGA